MNVTVGNRCYVTVSSRKGNSGGWNPLKGFHPVLRLLRQCSEMASSRRDTAR